MCQISASTALYVARQKFGVFRLYSIPNNCIYKLLPTPHLSVGTVELLVKSYPDGKVSGYMNALKVTIHKANLI